MVGQLFHSRRECPSYDKHGVWIDPTSRVVLRTLGMRFKPDSTGLKA